LPQSFEPTSRVDITQVPSRIMTCNSAPSCLNLLMTASKSSLGAEPRRQRRLQVSAVDEYGLKVEASSR
jgi:hypothetical protein